MAGLAALRVGAGLVTIATRPEHAERIGVTHPVLMAHGVTNASDLDNVLSKANVVVFGTGLKDERWSESLFDRLEQCSLPIVADAGALRLLARKKGQRKTWILTPHVGEAAALLDTTSAQIQSDRFAAVQNLYSRYHSTSVLKGAGSLVADGKRLTVCAEGNAGMSVAGMGDVLSGVLGGLLAQGMSYSDATITGVCIHAKAGDLAASSNPRGLIAVDLLPYIRQCVNLK